MNFVTSQPCLPTRHACLPHQGHGTYGFQPIEVTALYTWPLREAHPYQIPVCRNSKRDERARYLLSAHWRRVGSTLFDLPVSH